MPKLLAIFDQIFFYKFKNQSLLMPAQYIFKKVVLKFDIDFFRNVEVAKNRQIFKSQPTGSAIIMATQFINENSVECQ